MLSSIVSCLKKQNSLYNFSDANTAKFAPITENFDSTSIKLSLSAFKSLYRLDLTKKSARKSINIAYFSFLASYFLSVNSALLLKI